MLKKIIVSTLVAVLSASCALAFSVDRMARSVLPIAYDGQFRCTATNINSRMGYWLTAAHCLAGVSDDVKVTIGGSPAVVMEMDEIYDLAVVQVKGVKAKGLKIRAFPPSVGEKIYVYGHPLGYSVPQLFQGYVASVMTPLLYEGIEYRYMMYDMTVCGGNSGSSVVDNHHEIVSVVQIGHGPVCDGFSGGAPWLDLVLFAAKYVG